MRIRRSLLAIAALPLAALAGLALWMLARIAVLYLFYFIGMAVGSGDDVIRVIILAA